jgi:hypothetical protein
MTVLPAARRGLLAVALLAVLPGAAQAVAAPVPLAHELRPADVAVSGDRVVWSAYDAKIRRYVLRDADGRVAGVPAQKAPIDVDLGTDAQGKVVAVYSRCAARCHLYAYNFTKKAERRLKLSPATADDAQPSVDRGRVAFLRTVRGGLTDVRVGTLGGAKSTSAIQPGRKPKIVFHDPTIGAGNVAVIASYEDVSDNTFVDDLVLLRKGAKRLKTVASASGSQSPVDLLSPSFDAAGANLFWGQRASEQRNYLGRYALGTGKRTTATGSQSFYSLDFADPARGFLVGRLAPTYFGEETCFGLDDDGDEKTGTQEQSKCTVGFSGPVRFG